MKEMVFLCTESVKMEKWVCFIEASMRGLTALLEMDWFTLVWSADVPWNLRGHISTFFSSSECCSNSLPNGSFPYIVTFLIPTSVYGNDAQLWHAARNGKAFPWERLLPPASVTDENIKEEASKLLEANSRIQPSFANPSLQSLVLTAVLICTRNENLTKILKHILLGLGKTSFFRGFSLFYVCSWSGIAIK